MIHLFVFARTPFSLSFEFNCTRKKSQQHNLLLDFFFIFLDGAKDASSLETSAENARSHKKHQPALQMFCADNIRGLVPGVGIFQLLR